MKGKRLMLVLLVLLVGGGAAGAAWMLKPRAASAQRQPPSPPPVAETLAEVTTNLADAGQQRFVQVALTLQVDASAAKVYTDKTPAVQDAVIGVLRSRTSDQLAGGDGMRKLADDLKTAINGVLGGKHVVQIYFTHFVVQ